MFGVYMAELMPAPVRAVGAQPRWASNLEALIISGACVAVSVGLVLTTLLALFILTERVMVASTQARAWRTRVAAWRSSATHTTSPHEVTTFVGVAAIGAALALGAATSSSEDDVVDAVSLGVLALVAATIGAALLTLNALLAYVATPVGATDAWRKVVFDDAVNFGLYVLRVFLCWTRYIFYDVQVEGVDMALQQSDALFVGQA